MPDPLSSDTPAVHSDFPPTRAAVASSSSSLASLASLASAASAMLECSTCGVPWRQRNFAVTCR